MYWRDTGLLHAMMNVTDMGTLLTQPWVGASWEGYVIEQILGNAITAGIRLHPCYFRTSDGFELDLVLDFGPERWAIEVKLTSAPAPSDMEPLTRTAQMIDASRCFLITRTNTPSGDYQRASINLEVFCPLMLRVAKRKSKRP